MIAVKYIFHAEYIGNNNVSVITIDASTQSTLVHIAGGGQFRVYFTYTGLYPKNCTVSIADIASPIITYVTNTTPAIDSVIIAWDTDENSISLVR